MKKSTVTPGWFTTEYSSRLSGRQRRDTKPELLLRGTIHALGGRFRLQQRVAPRIAADIAFPRQKVAVFVDGCFWHGCPIHGRKEFRGPNAQNWIDKLRKNQERDQRATRWAEEDGWSVMRFWECEVLGNPEGIAKAVLQRVRAA